MSDKRFRESNTTNAVALFRAKDKSPEIFTDGKNAMYIQPFKKLAVGHIPKALQRVTNNGFHRKFALKYLF
ncbi:hypothetical protein AMR75_07460 [Vibrio fluvialis]|nr:hypothetical protein AMR75_07460 [Vibrio fluvialis]